MVMSLLMPLLLLKILKFIIIQVFHIDLKFYKISFYFYHFLFLFTFPLTQNKQHM